MSAPVPFGTSSVVAPAFGVARVKSNTLSEAATPAPLIPTYASFEPSGAKFGIPRCALSRPALGTCRPVAVSHKPAAAPGGPGSGDEFSTRYLPFGVSAGLDQLRFVGSPGAPPTS